MGRINRKSSLCNGCYAHIISRAADKRYIFRGEEDFLKFKQILKESKTKFSYKIHHYCLMHTHFHLAGSMQDARLFSRRIEGARHQKRGQVRKNKEWVE